MRPPGLPPHRHQRPDRGRRPARHELPSPAGGGPGRGAWGLMPQAPLDQPRRCSDRPPCAHSRAACTSAAPRPAWPAASSTTRPAPPSACPPRPPPARPAADRPARSSGRPRLAASSTGVSGGPVPQQDVPRLGQQRAPGARDRVVEGDDEIARPPPPRPAAGCPRAGSAGPTARSRRNRAPAAPPPAPPPPAGPRCRAP